MNKYFVIPDASYHLKLINFLPQIACPPDIREKSATFAINILFMIRKSLLFLIRVTAFFVVKGL